MNNEPAFPVSTRLSDDGLSFGHQDSPSTWQYAGMTLRDYFAAKALQAYLAHADAVNQRVDVTAMRSYNMADAMLKVRSQQ